MKSNEPAPGFIKTLLNITVCELPAVTLLPSGTVDAEILTPGFELDIVNVPSTKPVVVSCDCIIA